MRHCQGPLGITPAPRFLALYKGIVPKIMRLGPGGAIMLLVYESMHDYLTTRSPPRTEEYHQYYQLSSSCPGSLTETPHHCQSNVGNTQTCGVSPQARNYYTTVPPHQY